MVELFSLVLVVVSPVMVVLPAVLVSSVVVVSAAGRRKIVVRVGMRRRWRLQRDSVVKDYRSLIARTK